MVLARAGLDPDDYLGQDDFKHLFSDLKRPEIAIRYFIRFIIAKVLVTQGMELMSAIFKICAGVITTITKSLGPVDKSLVLPQAVVDGIEKHSTAPDDGINTCV